MTLLVSLIAATLRVATPLIFATLGELFCERAGILNLGIEGTMFFGAFTGFTAASLTGSLWLGLIWCHYERHAGRIVDEPVCCKTRRQPACFRIGDHPTDHCPLSFLVSA